MDGVLLGLALSCLMLAFAAIPFGVTAHVIGILRSRYHDWTDWCSLAFLVLVDIGAVLFAASWFAYLAQQD